MCNLIRYDCIWFNVDAIENDDDEGKKNNNALRQILTPTRLNMLIWMDKNSIGKALAQIISHIQDMRPQTSKRERARESRRKRAMEKNICCMLFSF